MSTMLLASCAISRFFPVVDGASTRRTLDGSRWRKVPVGVGHLPLLPCSLATTASAGAVASALGHLAQRVNKSVDTSLFGKTGELSAVA